MGRTGAGIPPEAWEGGEREGLWQLLEVQQGRSLLSGIVAHGIGHIFCPPVICMAAVGGIAEDAKGAGKLQ